MRRVTWTLVVLGILATRPAAADGAPASAPALSSAPASPPASAPALSSAPAPTPALAPAPASPRSGLAVLALSGATDAAWPLARAIYADPTLRPGSVDEPHARVLCGETPAAGDPADLRDLSETVAAVHGDDAPSRALLDGIARTFAVRGVIVVRAEGGHPSARVFLAETAAFDAATYGPDDAPALSWAATTRSLDRLFVPLALSPAPPAPPARSASGVVPSLATHEAPKAESSTASRPFYESLWFWGAVGAAALAGGAAYLATRDTSASTIHLEVQVPH
jgi:hypothetical protein